MWLQQFFEETVAKYALTLKTRPKKFSSPLEERKKDLGELLKIKNGDQILKAV